MALQETGLKFVADNAKGFIDATNDASQAERGFAGESQKAAQASEKAHGSIIDGLQNIAKVALGATLAAIGALTAAVIGATTAFGDWADKLDSVGDVLGTTADESAAFTVAIKGVGGNVEETVGQIARFTKGLKDNKGKLTETGKLAKKMGIAFEDANGNLLSATEITQNLADKLAVLPDGLEKTGLMEQFLGKSGRGASDVLNALANGGMEAARKKAIALGLAIGDKGVDSAIAMKKAMADLDLAGKGLSVSLGSILMPVILPLIQAFSEWAVGIVPKVRDGFVKIGEAIAPIIDWFSKLFEKIGAVAKAFGMGYTQPLVKMLEGWAALFLNWIRDDVIPFIGEKVTELSTAIGTWITTDAPLIGTAIGEWSGKLLNWITSDVIPFIGDRVTTLKTEITTWITTNAPLIAKQLQDWADVFLAWVNKDVVPFVQTNLNPIYEEIKTWIETQPAKIGKWIGEKWTIFKDWIEKDIVPNLPKELEKIITAIGTWVQTAVSEIPALVAPLAEAITKFIVEKAIPWLFDQENGFPKFAGQMILAIGGIIVIIAASLAALALAIVVGIIVGVGKYIVEKAKELYVLGKQIVEAIAEGIRQSLDSLRKAFEWLFEQVIAAIKRQYGWGSPPKYFIQMGREMMQALQMGWMSEGLNLPAPGISGMNTVHGIASPSQAAGSYSYANSRTYNLNVNSRQSMAGIQQEFALMEALSG